MFETASLLSVIAVAAVAASPGPVLPRTEAETASGKSVTLPDAAAERIAVLIVGFSRKSSTPAGRWEDKLTHDYESFPRVAVFRIAVLESLPRLFRGLLRAGIESNVPKNRRDSFVLLFHQEEAWKNLAQFGAPDDAYIVLLDGAGRMFWRRHGSADGIPYDALKAQISVLLNRASAGEK
jgi:hypothetical protein